MMHSQRLAAVAQQMMCDIFLARNAAQAASDCEFVESNDNVISISNGDNGDWQEDILRVSDEKCVVVSV